MGVALYAHLALGHGLQQGALHLGAGAVDLVRQQHLGKDGAGVKAKLLLVGVKDLQPQQVGRQQIGGELYPSTVQPQHLRQPVGQGGLAHAGQILDQQVTTGQQGHQGYLELQRLAQDHLLQRRQQSCYVLLSLHPRLPCLLSPLQLIRQRREKAGNSGINP